MVQSYKFTLNEIDITSHVLAETTIVLSKQQTTGNTASLKVDNSILSTISDLSAGMEILIQRGTLSSTETKIFKGNIKRISNTGTFIILDCTDPIQQLVHDYFTTSYDRDIDVEQGEISAIAQDIIVEGGFTASVVASGKESTDITIKKFISKDQSRLNRLQRLSKLIDYLFYYDYENDWIRFEPLSNVDYPTQLIVGSNILNIPIWEEDIENMRNKITVKGAYEEDTRNEEFNGDGSNISFKLINEPEITEIYVNSILQKRGVPESTLNYDYYVDKTLKTIYFTTAPSVGTNNVDIIYTTRLPAPATSIEPTSVAKYNLTQGEIFTFDDIVNVEDAETRVNNLLSRFAFPKPKTTLEVNLFDIKPGDLVDVIDTININKSGSYVVQKVIMKYPGFSDIIEIGDPKLEGLELIESIQTRIRDLEEKETNLTQLLRQLIGLSKEYTYERRYCNLEIKNITGDTLIWGHNDYGIWGDENWGTETTTSFILGHHTYGILGENKLGESGIAVRRDIMTVQQNNTYKEYLYDEDFLDVTSTGNWNTTTKEITLLAGDFIVTNNIMKGPVPSYFTINLPNTSGDFSTEISGDGGVTWQEATLGQRTAFTTVDDKGVKLRITNLSAGNAFPTAFGTWGAVGAVSVIISNTYNSYGEYTQPSINLFLEE